MAHGGKIKWRGQINVQHQRQRRQANGGTMAAAEALCGAGGIA